MATISNTPRPGYVYDSTDAVWYPIGTGTHSHNEIASTIVDAKGDIITATAADTPARLAVGNNGDTLVADSAATTGLSWSPSFGFSAGKNKIINGDFRVWQRGTTFTSPAAGAYTADRWTTNQDGNGTVTVSQQSFTPGTAPVAGYEAPFFLRQAVTATGTTTFFQMSQKIEDVRTFANQTVTFSFWAKADSSRTGLVYWEQVFGSGGSATVQSTVFPAPALTTAWQRFTYTFTLPSISGKTIGTGSHLIFYIRNGGTVSGANLDIWGAQLEAGSVATAFQTATGTLQGELAACQRYFCKTFPLATAPASNAGQAGSYLAGRAYGAQAVAYVFYWQFPVSMRATPTITTYNPSAAGSAWFDEDGNAKTAAVGNTSNNATSIYNSATATPNKNALIHATAEIEL